MIAAGVVRKLDALGRVVLPIDLRRKYGIDIYDDLEIDVNGDCIVLTKYIPKCIFCSSTEGVQEIKGKKICNTCLSNIKAL